MRCKYKKRDGSTCGRKAFSERGLCLLHENWKHKREQETREEFLKEIQDGITDFEGCIIPGFDYSGGKFEWSLVFMDAIIKGSVFLNDITIEGNISFDDATVEGDISLGGAIIQENVFLRGATIKKDALFGDATIWEDVWLIEATIEGDVSFGNAIIKGSAWFWRTTIKKDALFGNATIWNDAWFREATIKGGTSFDMATIEGTASFEKATFGKNVTFLASNTHLLTFVDATFHDIREQETACREAKRTQEQAGNRELADYHFYREMEAKRKQRHPIMRFIELPLQYLFGYGVYPSRVALTWLSIIALFTLVYWYGKAIEGTGSLLGYIYFSVITAATPGYGGYRPVSGVWQGVASIEAIMGTFMWAALIATFARKFMR
jgi:hypothetical protein